MFVKLPEVEPARALKVLKGFTDRLVSTPLPLRLGMTKLKGREMVMHKEFNKRTGIAVYFCDRLSPWQKGSNENTNGAWRGSTSRRVRICLATFRKSGMKWPIKSMTAHEKV